MPHHPTITLKEKPKVVVVKGRAKGPTVVLSPIQPVTFQSLRAANSKRGLEWDKKSASLDDLSFRAMELGGESGEVLNACKKLVRQLRGVKGGVPFVASRNHIAEELADVVICADRIAEVMNIDLPSALRDKFNKTSRKNRLKTKL